MQINQLRVNKVRIPSPNFESASLSIYLLIATMLPRFTWVKYICHINRKVVLFPILNFGRLRGLNLVYHLSYQPLTTFNLFVKVLRSTKEGQ